MTAKVLVPVADGTEMLEALSIVDVFRRAGAQVDLASVHDLVITSSHGVKIHADKQIDQCREESYDLIAVPGGIPGAQNLQQSAALTDILRRQKDADKFYGAICAAPALVLEHHGLLQGRKATGHPLFVEAIVNRADPAMKVVRDGNCITSKGAGTSIDFALELVGIVMGEEKMREVAKGMAVEID